MNTKKHEQEHCFRTKNKNMERQIVHINPDDFFASVMRVKDATLQNKPLIIGHLNSRGCVISASYEARQDGVHPGLTMAQAKRICPAGSLIQVDWDLFYRVSGYILQVVQQYSPLVERAGLEEAFLDYTGCGRLFGAPLDACRRIKHDIKNRVSIDVSIGMASNKLVSKIASGAAKRSSLVDVFPGYERSFLAAFPVSRLPGIGPRFLGRLHEMSIEHIGDIPPIPVQLLEHVFGKKGQMLHNYACGIDTAPVRPLRKNSASRVATTFKADVVSLMELESRLFLLAEKLGSRLRSEGTLASRLSLSYVHADQIRVTRTVVLPCPTDRDIQVYQAMVPVFRASYTRRVRVRSMSLLATAFSLNSGQLELFENPVNTKLNNLYKAMDAIRKRFPHAQYLMTGRTLDIVPSISRHHSGTQCDFKI